MREAESDIGINVWCWLLCLISLPDNDNSTAKSRYLFCLPQKGTKNRKAPYMGVVMLMEGMMHGVNLDSRFISVDGDQLACMYRCEDGCFVQLHKVSLQMNEASAAFCPCHLPCSWRKIPLHPVHTYLAVLLSSIPFAFHRSITKLIIHHSHLEFHRNHVSDHQWCMWFFGCQFLWPSNKTHQLIWRYYQESKMGTENANRCWHRDWIWKCIN